MLLRKRAARRCRSVGALPARRFAGAASATATLFPGFERATVRSTAMGTPDINVVHSPKPGAPTLLLLHGYPQTHVEWHKVAPPLAERFAVVCPDLRGYGDSSKPERGDHDMYSKRTTAADVLSVLRELGYAEPVHVVGHDVRLAPLPPNRPARPAHSTTLHVGLRGWQRGSRVGHRLALDAPSSVRSFTTLDVVPSQPAFENMDADLSFAWFHWHLMRQPEP